MKVRFWPKSVIRLSFPSAVDATQMLVPRPSSRGHDQPFPVSGNHRMQALPNRHTLARDPRQQLRWPSSGRATRSS